MSGDGARVDGLALRVDGAGAALVLLHGFTGSADAWPASSVRALSDRVRVVRVDLPGHGDASVDPADAEAFAVERTVARLRRLADHLGPEPAHWLGYSMGGRLALLAAVAGVPMRSLVLESASAGIEGEAGRSDRRMRDAALAARLRTEPLDRFVDDWMALPLFASQRSLDADVLEGERARRLRADPTGLAAALDGFGTGVQPWVGDALGRVDVPVTLLTGDLDEKFSTAARVLEDGLPIARRHTFAGVGHATHLERPEAWVDAIRDHLAWVEERA